MTDVFKNYPAADLPAIPAGWTCKREDGDACPSYAHKGLRIWIDYLDPEARDWPLSYRYSVMWDAIDGDNGGISLLSTNDWDDVLRFVENHREVGHV